MTNQGKQNRNLKLGLIKSVFIPRTLQRKDKTVVRRQKEHLRQGVGEPLLDETPTQLNSIAFNNTLWCSE